MFPANELTTAIGVRVVYRNGFTKYGAEHSMEIGNIDFDINSCCGHDIPFGFDSNNANAATVATVGDSILFSLGFTKSLVVNATAAGTSLSVPSTFALSQALYLNVTSLTLDGNVSLSMYSAMQWGI